MKKCDNCFELFPDSFLHELDGFYLCNQCEYEVREKAERTREELI